MCQKEKESKAEDQNRRDESIEAERQSQPGNNPFARRRLSKIRNSPTVDKQRSIVCYSTVKKFGKKSAQQLMADLKVGMFLITAGRAYHLADGKPLRDLLEFAMPEMHLKCSRTFAR